MVLSICELVNTEHTWWHQFTFTH